MAGQRGDTSPDTGHPSGATEPTEQTTPIDLTAVVADDDRAVDDRAVDDDAIHDDDTVVVADDDRADDDRAVQNDDTAPANTDSATGRRGFRARRIAIGVALLVGVAGAGMIGTTGLRILQQKDATLAPPETVAGLRRDTSAGAQKTAEDLRTALAAGIDLEKTMSVVYADPANAERNVFLLGGTALLFSPEKELDAVLDLLGEHGDAGMRQVAAGDFGGVMKCGTVEVPDGQMSACGWADHGSIAVAMFPERDVTAAGTLMRQLRDATQTR